VRVSVHLFWHNEAMAPLLAPRVARWAALGHDAHLWLTAELPPELVRDALRSRAGVAHRDHPRHLANVARWHLLHTFGGVWADTDVWPLHALPPDLAEADHPWCASLGPLPTPFMCGGPPGARLWARALEQSLSAPMGTSPEASGGRMLGRIAQPGEIDLEPAGRFAEHDAAGRPLSYDGQRLSVHRWATSANRAGARATGPASRGEPCRYER
jgi:hypothetical protein